MSILKKCTALTLALTLLGGVALQANSIFDIGTTVYAAGITDDFIVKDFDTGEIVSASRMITIFNSPSVDNTDNYKEELTKEKVTEKVNKKTGELISRVTVLTKYMARDFIIPEDFVGLTDNPNYSGYVIAGNVHGQEHLYLVTTIVEHTITETFKDGELDETKNSYKVKQTPKGSYNLLFTKVDGETYRTFVVNVNQTASSLNTSIKYMNSDKKYTLSTDAGMIVVANHTLQLTASIDKNSTDELQYRILEDKSPDASESDLAKIDQDGVITTLSNGTAYLEISHKNNDNYTVPKVITDKETKDQELKFEQFLPQYYPLYIVKENPAKKIVIDKKYSTLKKGDKRQLTVTVTPTYTEDEYPTSATDILTWSSSNTKVVKVSENGLITAVGAGEATITVRGENSLVKDSFTLKVTVPVANMEITPNGVETYVGLTEDISVLLKPEYSDEKIYWKSSNESVLTVTAGSKELVKKNYKYNAKLNAKKAGTAIVTAYTASGIRASITVTVNKLPKIDAIKLMYGSRIITVNTCNIFTGQTLYFTMMSMAGNVEVPFDPIKVTISKGGSDIAKATINKEGLVTLVGLSRGSLKLYFKSTINTDLKRTVIVNIKRPADYVDYTVDGKEQKSIVLFVGDKAQINAELKTKNADGIHDDKIVSYTSSDKAVATVDKTGKITAKGEGKAQIKLKTESSQEMQLVTVNVIKVSKVEIKQVKDGVYATNAKLGSTLITNVYAYDTTNKRYENVKVNWTLDNTGILSVTSENKLKVEKLGTTTVTCKVGGVKASFKVKITHDISTVKFTEEERVELNTIVKPKMYLMDNTYKLIEGVDYTVDVVKNPVVGKNVTYVHGKGNYFGDLKLTFNVREHYMEDVSISGITNVVYTGKAITQKLVLKFNNKTLKEGTDYVVSYVNNINAGTAKINITGKGNFKNTVTKTFQITPAAISKCTITIADATYSTKTGKGEPKVTVKFGDTTLKNGKDYTVTYSGNNKLGVATAVIKGTGNFNSFVSKSFKVISKYPLKITVPASSYSISVGAMKKLTYTVVDAAYVTDKSATFTTDNKKVATVDKNGVVTGKGKGTATITINAHGAKATIKIYVK